MQAILVFSDNACLAHRASGHHPESPQRLVAIRERLERQPIAGVRLLPCSRASKDELLLVHDANYVDHLFALDGQSVALDTDTHYGPGTLEAALASAGGAIDAVRAVCSGEASAAFSLCRPPGHHAEPGRAMGFCFFNNAAIAAAYAREQLGCRRVLLVDWDVHHGNGSQTAFWQRRDVLFLSTHRWPLYPMTGTLDEVGGGAGEGYTLNVPLPAGMGDGDYLAVLREVLVPIATAYEPDLIVVSAGFDAHERDPLGGMSVTSEGFAQLAAVLRDLAERCAEGRIAFVLEGGYDLQGLSESVHACIRTLAHPQVKAPPTSPPPSPRGAEAIAAAKAAFAPYWDPIAAEASNG